MGCLQSGAAKDDAKPAGGAREEKPPEPKAVGPGGTASGANNSQTEPEEPPPPQAVPQQPQQPPPQPGKPDEPPPAKEPAPPAADNKPSAGGAGGGAASGGGGGGGSDELPKPVVSITVNGEMGGSGPVSADVSWTGMVKPSQEDSKDFCGIYKVADSGKETSDKQYMTFQKLKIDEAYPDGKIAIAIDKIGLSKDHKYEVRICRCTANAQYLRIAQQPITVSWAG